MHCSFMCWDTIELNCENFLKPRSKQRLKHWATSSLAPSWSWLGGDDKEEHSAHFTGKVQKARGMCTDTSKHSANKPLPLLSLYLLSLPTHSHTHTQTHKHTDNESFVRLLSRSVKWPVLSPSCHTQALSVQTPDSGLFSHLHLPSSLDLRAYQTQDKRLKAFSLHYIHLWQGLRSGNTPLGPFKTTEPK